MEKKNTALSKATMKILISILSLLPLRALYALSDYLISPLMYYVVRYRRSLSYRNIRTSFPEKSEKEIVKIQKNFYHHLADIIVEIIYSYRISDKEMFQAVQYKSLDLVEQLAQKHHGVILMLGHLGNWEYIAHIKPHFSYSEMQNFNVYRKLNNHSADQIMLQMRERFCGKGSCIEKRSLLRRLLSIRQQNTCFSLALIADQKPSPGNDYYWTEFLHHDTGFLGGAEILAKKLGFPVVYANISSPSRGKYIAEFSLITDNPIHTEPYFITEQYARRLEANIQQHPEQWLWTHNRWKWSRPSR